MKEHAPKDRLSEFDARLNRLKEENSARSGAAAGRRTSGYGMAFTMAADLVGGVAGGTGLGWLLDRWLGSSPLCLIVFFFLGAAAGMWNVYRSARGYDTGWVSVAPPKERRDETAAPAGAASDKEGGDQRGQSTPSIHRRADPPDPDR